MEKGNFISMLENNDLVVGVLVTIYGLALIFVSMYFS